MAQSNPSVGSHLGQGGRTADGQEKSQHDETHLPAVRPPYRRCQCQQRPPISRLESGIVHEAFVVRRAAGVEHVLAAGKHFCGAVVIRDVRMELGKRPADEPAARVN